MGLYRVFSPSVHSSVHEIQTLFEVCLLFYWLWVMYLHFTSVFDRGLGLKLVQYLIVLSVVEIGAIFDCLAQCTAWDRI